MRRVSRLRAGVATLTAGFVLFAAACTPGTSPGSRPIPPGGGVAAYTAGSAGLGDPYYPDAGNGGYDVASYLLDLRYDPGTDTLAGSATITAVATANLSQFNLDFRALTVHAVTIDGIVAGARTAGDELVVSPGLGIIKGRQFVIAVRYSGVPSGYDDPALGEMGFLHTKDGAVAIGEPHVAASWFPVNDHPSDKATYTIKITAPEGLAALSNGVLRNRQSDSGWTTWTWLESQPMAPYLAMVAIGRYRVAQRTSGTRQLVTAVDAALPEGIDAQLARTPAIVAFLESRFGPYPFDALGGIVIDDSRINFSEPGGSLGWALENQSRPLYSRIFFEPGEDGTWVIVHELAHQWFGNSVTVRDWSEIWLNEGFATYAEWLWFDDKGVRSAQQTFDDLYAKANAPMWQVPPGDPGRDRMFDPSHSVYDRGAMTLHALRLRVGDDTFFTILKGWAAQKVHQNATTDEFIAFAEKISGVALDALFQEWLYELGRPPLPRR